MKFYDFVQENKFLLCFSSGLLSTLVFSTTYFWVSSIVVGVGVLLFTKSFTTFVGVTLGLLVGACHFLNFDEVASNSHCFNEPFEFIAEVTDFPVSLMGKSGDALSLLTFRLLKADAGDECHSLNTASAIAVESGDQKLMLPGDLVPVKRA